MGECSRQDPVSTDTGRPLIRSHSRKDAIILHQDNNVSELNSEKETEEPVRDLLHREPDVPLFIKDSPDGQKGDPQDEKDKTGE